MQTNCLPSNPCPRTGTFYPSYATCQVFCWIISTNFNKIKLAENLARYISFMWLEDRGQILH